jgi:hypothetical protein
LRIWQQPSGRFLVIERKLTLFQKNSSPGRVMNFLFVDMMKKSTSFQKESMDFQIKAV